MVNVEVFSLSVWKTELFTGSGLKTLYLLLADTVVHTSVVLQPTLALVTGQLWFRGRDFPTKTWNLYNSTQQVSTERDVSSLKVAEGREVIWLTVREKDLWKDTHQQPRI